jgi:DNA invertase Pin-like site-specific DNA recombinase
MTVRCVGYCRVSTSRQAELGDSLEVQEEKIRQWAVMNEATEVVIYKDEGISGKRSANRPGYQAVLSAVGKGDALVCYSLSRLSRSTKDTLALGDLLEKRGADLVSLSEKIDTSSAAGKMVFRMLAVLAQFMSDQLGENMTVAWEGKRGKGEKCGGDLPYGYCVRAGKLCPHAGEQKGVRMVVNLHKKGESLRGIGRSLKDAGIANRSGSLDWHPVAVQRIIKWQEREQKENKA